METLSTLADDTEHFVFASAAVCTYVVRAFV